MAYLKLSKRCCHCGEIKPLDCFTKDRNTKDGLKKACKTCRNADYKAYHNAHPDKALARSSRWSQNNKYKRCESAKKIYYKDVVLSRIKSNERKRTEIGRARVRRYNSARRCANSHQCNNLTANDVELLLKHQEGRCARCQKMFSNRLPFTVDHIVPLSKGGGLTPNNVQLLCRSCNSIKNDKTILYRLLLPTEAGAGGL